MGEGVRRSVRRTRREQWGAARKVYKCLCRGRKGSTGVGAGDANGLPMSVPGASGASGRKGFLLGAAFGRRRLSERKNRTGIGRESGDFV